MTYFISKEKSGKGMSFIVIVKVLPSTCSFSPLGSGSQISGLIVARCGPLQPTHLHREGGEVLRQQCNYSAWGKPIVHPRPKKVCATV